MRTGTCVVCGRETMHTIYNGLLQQFVCATYDQERIGITPYDTCKRFVADVMEEYGHDMFDSELTKKLQRLGMKQRVSIAAALERSGKPDYATGFALHKQEGSGR